MLAIAAAIVFGLGLLLDLIGTSIAGISGTTFLLLGLLLLALHQAGIGTQAPRGAGTGAAPGADRPRRRRPRTTPMKRSALHTDGAPFTVGHPRDEAYPKGPVHTRRSAIHTDGAPSVVGHLGDEAYSEEPVQTLKNIVMNVPDAPVSKVMSELTIRATHNPMPLVA